MNLLRSLLFTLTVFLFTVTTR